MRRAIVLHDMLERRHKDAGKPLPDGPLLDAGAAWAMLEVTGFRHGVRSLEAVLHMSDFEPGQTLTASRLPDGEQIDMHVDAKAWAKAIREGPDKLDWVKWSASGP